MPILHTLTAVLAFASAPAIAAPSSHIDSELVERDTTALDTRDSGLIADITDLWKRKGGGGGGGKGGGGGGGSSSSGGKGGGSSSSGGSSGYVSSSPVRSGSGSSGRNGGVGSSTSPAGSSSQNQVGSSSTSSDSIRQRKKRKGGGFGGFVDSVDSVVVAEVRVRALLTVDLEVRHHQEVVVHRDPALEARQGQVPAHLLDLEALMQEARKHHTHLAGARLRESLQCC